MKSSTSKHLNYRNLNSLRKLAKADCHNHAVWGGNFQKVLKKTKLKIPAPPKSYTSLSHLNEYISKFSQQMANVKTYGTFLEAAFEQALMDGVDHLIMSFHARLHEVIGLSPKQYIKLINGIHKSAAPSIKLIPQLGFHIQEPIQNSISLLNKFSQFEYFKSIDLYGDELDFPIQNFKPLFRNAALFGMKKSCHIGEYGSAARIEKAVNELELDEVQHGISAVQSKRVLKFLERNKIILHLCPISNVKCGLVSGLSNYPLKIFLDHGVRITINTDDVFLFKDGLSEQYFKLLRNRTISWQELDSIRWMGINYCKDVLNKIA